MNYTSELYRKSLEDASKLGLDYSSMPIGMVHAAICFSEEQENPSLGSDEIAALEEKVKDSLRLAFESLPRNNNGKSAQRFAGQTG